MRLSSKFQGHFGSLVIPFGNGEVHDVIHQNALLSDVLPIIFHLQDRAGITHYSVPVEKGSQVGLKNLSSDFISRVIQINSGEEDDEATSERTASACQVAWAAGDILPMILVRNRIRGVIGG